MQQSKINTILLAAVLAIQQDLCGRCKLPSAWKLAAHVRSLRLSKLILSYILAKDFVYEYGGSLLMWTPNLDQS